MATTEQPETANTVVCNPMDDDYDVILLGTGVVECMLCGMLIRSCKKVLQLEKEPFAGGESVSYNLEQQFRKFRQTGAPGHLGKPHEYFIEQRPKLAMRGGPFIKILNNTLSHRYNVDPIVIEGSYVHRDGKIHKVPGSDKEAGSSKLMGTWEKRRAAKLLGWVGDYKQEDPKTHRGLNLQQVTMKQVFEEFGLDDKTQEFLGHAAALHRTDEYLNQPAHPTLIKLQLYAESANMYGQSPFLYPAYGLGGLPHAIQRLCAVSGSAMLLDKTITRMEFNKHGKFVGVTDSDGVTAHAPFLVGHPSYFAGTDRVRHIGQVVRCLCIMDHPIPNTADRAKSCQIIMPQKELGRQNDIFILCLNSELKVVPEPYYLALVSTMVESTDPEQDLAPGMELVGDVLEKFVSVEDFYEPADDGTESQCLVCKGMDSSTHCETLCADLLSLFRRLVDRDYEPDGVDKDPKQED